MRKVIRANLPKGYRESIGWGCITYEVPLKVYPDTYNGQPLGVAALDLHRPPDLGCTDPWRPRHHRPEDVPRGGPVEREPAARLVRREPADPLHAAERHGHPSVDRDLPHAAVPRSGPQDACVRMQTLVREQRLAEARVLQHWVTPLARSVGSAYGVAGLKAALDLAGYKGGVPRPPMRKAPSLVIETISNQLAALGAFKELAAETH